LLRYQTGSHSVDSAATHAAAKIPGSASRSEFGLRRHRGQCFVHGGNGHSVSLGKRGGEVLRAPGDGCRSVALGHADHELRGAPIIHESVDVRPGDVAVDTQSRERRGCSGREIGGGDADTP